MNETLSKILNSIKLSSDDKNNFWQTALDIIKMNDSLHNEDDNFKKLRFFLKDTILFQNSEINYIKQYIPSVYDENVALSKIHERDIYQEILNKLEEK